MALHKNLRIKKINRMTLFDYINYAFIFLLCLAFVYPVFLTFSISISDPGRASAEKIFFLPKGFSLDAFQFLLRDGRILRYYANSIFYAVAGTVVFLLFTSLMAYPFIVNELKGKKYLNIFLLVTMFFSGGLIPYYFTIRALGLIDNVLVMIIPGAVAAYTVIVFKTFFNQIPTSLREAATIDGAGHYMILFRVIFPVSKPLLATFALFTMVGKWNDYFTALLFFRNDSLQPVQILLRRLLVLVEYKDVANSQWLMMYEVTSRTIKSAAVIITIAPILCVYPFLQKYFTKGVMVGSFKG